MTQLKRSLLGSIALVLLTGPSLAGGIKIDTNNLDRFSRDQQYDWSGFYTGASAIYTFEYKGTGQLTDEGYGHLQPQGQGPKAGAYAGYNFQVNSFVFGGEVDVNYGWNNGQRFMDGVYQSVSTPLYLKFRQTASYALRGRLGYAFNDFMVFGSLGMASSTIKNSGRIIARGPVTDNLGNTTIQNILYNALVRSAENGYTFGLGFEYGINNNWLFRTEYIYSNYDRKSPNVSWDVRMGLQEHETRTSLAYKF